jgi:phage N-6-adenine-methyltransferase
MTTLQLSLQIHTEAPKSDLNNDENYTPENIIKPFREFVGGFDLDPFSNAIANQTVQAKTYWTKEDDAFSKAWSPYLKKWVNPPYSKGNIERAVRLVLAHHGIGSTFLLTNSNTSSSWYQDCLSCCSAFLLFGRRINFYNPSKPDQNGNAKSQTLFYFGDETERLISECSYLGVICKCH